MEKTAKKKILDTRKIRKAKFATTKSSLQMLTCYDFQTAQMLNTTDIDLLLIGDSAGNVVLGKDTTVEVTLEEMIMLGSAVKRGAPEKFTVVDMPFGSYSTFDEAIKNATKLFKETKCESIKLEGAFDYQLEIIKRLTQSGIPVMGHIGLTPQSVHELGGYYTHGKNKEDQEKLMAEAIKLEKAGCFAIVLECVQEDISSKITKTLSIPTIGIGAGRGTDGQVLVINDLLKMGPNTPPKFCTPIADLFQLKRDLITEYINDQRESDNAQLSHH
ncbi:3-methyl-2-oxobutanoate hydroxymethyltransferase [Bacteriovorax sp. Seq25_V]|uniref:3-methyl-2-oxobutanoate hydroxymethyltransferase n=1 Tax=Bacteriovorax sp. Seq25_V TaxID=1201288 RepID=UPI000389FB76|nr:3-methyl-2-oxobutanoate hydroxymethyltransferase [Bacteriovorax sp. Seq25_V]EQC47598.1 3-methyl-2-oxobutanoate hydroxymethyltransferase [Bacteriovorax sp. Seq25_V]